MEEQLRMFEMPEASNSSENIDLEQLRDQPHLEIYEKQVILTNRNNLIENVWSEGKQSSSAQKRYQQIRNALGRGFFSQKIEQAKSPEVISVVEAKLSAAQRRALEEIFTSVTAQSGRALIDIFVLQLVIKTICPDQDIRLHKANNSRGSFSWKEGVSMRSIDSTYIVPTLREYDLLRMNQYGAYMTRTFAENYPYTKFYKAEIKGAKQQGKQRWLEVIDDLENQKMDAEAALLYVLQILWKSSEAFNTLVQETLIALNGWLVKNSTPSRRSVTSLIKKHIEKSEARARLLEVAIHALFQALKDLDVDLGGRLKPLMPMRTANLKHGNIGDIEILSGDLVIEAWDAKYDQPYLSDALDELVDKVRQRNVSELHFGYVLLPEKKEYSEVQRKVDEIEEQYGFKAYILSFDEWIHEQFLHNQNTIESEEQLAAAWLRAYTESLCLKRRKEAPIDEPTFEWVESLLRTLTTS